MDSGGVVCGYIPCYKKVGFDNTFIFKAIDYLFQSKFLFRLSRRNQVVFALLQLHMNIIPQNARARNTIYILQSQGRQIVLLS